MKNIWNKISIHPLTYFFIISGLITGYFNMLIAIILIVFFHELGHIITIRYYDYNITKIEFFPFGGITKIDKDINSSIKEEILISLSGIFMQVILGFIILLLHNKGFIRSEFYMLFKLYNISILVFNLMPIIPLDGHIFIKSILEFFYSFKLSFIISAIISVLFLFLFLYLNIILNLNNYIMVTFLIYKLWETIKRFKFIQTRFYLERYLHNYNYPKIKLIEGINLNKMYKEKTHYFIKDDKYIEESVILKKKFDNKRLI